MQPGRGGHQEPFHGPRGANEDLEEQIAFPVSQSKGCSCFLKCLKKGKRKGLLLFLDTSLVCWNMALKALNKLSAPGAGSGSHTSTRGKAKVYRTISSPGENILPCPAHHQPFSHLVWREMQNTGAIKKPVSNLLSNLYTHISYLLTHLIITNFFCRQWIS